MAAAMGLAEEDWDDRFAESEAAEESERRRRVAERRASETQYVIGRGENPLLIDEGNSWSEWRDAARLQWAEDRLRELGFITQPYLLWTLR
jgi:hypothetical protein